MFLAIVLLILSFPIGLVYLLIGRTENTEIVALCNNYGYKNRDVINLTSFFM